tara:strand:+ start:482 stop:640 length:159 start_codon:yes stop_codon:yes gene_type:complete
MILLIAIRFLFIVMYHGSIAFGTFVATAFADALFDKLEEWSMNRARQVVVVQ